MKNLVFGALGAGILCACGTVAVRVPVMKPAEINMAPYQSVAVGDMTGAGNRPMTNAGAPVAPAASRWWTASTWSR